MKLDAHQHFWRYSPAEYSWIGPTMQRLKRDYLPADLVPLLTEAGLDGAIAVQARQTLDETAWLLELADQHSFIQGVVGWVDLCSPDVGNQLERFSAHPKFCGVRHLLQDEPDDRFMLRVEFVHGLGLLAEFDLTYDILIHPRHLPAACELVAKFPEQPFVLDHVAKPFIKDRLLSSWAADLKRLAAFPHVCCKVSGLVTEADWRHWQPADFRPYLDVVFAAFGPERLMFGSDWPVCTLAATYAQVVELIVDYTRSLSQAEQAQVWGEAVCRFYKIEPILHRRENYAL